MGLSMSFMGLGGGLPSGQMLNFLMGTVYQQFVDKDIRNFEDFQFAILDIFNTFNSALPGKHYDVPSRKEIEAVFILWKEAIGQDKKKNIFIQFMKKYVRLSKVDNATVITGVVTPPVAMAAKRAGESVPQLKMIKAIPDVVFVPSATVLALMSVKISRRIFAAKIASSTHSDPEIQVTAPPAIGNSHEEREILPSAQPPSFPPEPRPLSPEPEHPSPAWRVFNEMPEHPSPAWKVFNEMPERRHAVAAASDL